jgi:ATP-dependent DNA helicase PIF1
MIIYGTAGTGKSYLINAIASQLKDDCCLTATTGIAAFNINGVTIHSLLQLPVRNQGAKI